MSEINEKKVERYVVLRDIQSGQVSWVKLRIAEIEGILKSVEDPRFVILVTDDPAEAGKCWAQHNS